MIINNHGDILEKYAEMLNKAVLSERTYHVTATSQQRWRNIEKPEWTTIPTRRWRHWIWGVRLFTQKNE